MSDCVQQRKRHSPLVLTETATISREEWLEYRRRGIGGSDVASLMGILQIDFVWLCHVGNDILKGQQQRIRLPFESFEKNGEKNQEKKVLAMEERYPRVVFKSRKNLKQVSDNKALRRKLARFLNSHFAWPGYERIEITDDFIAYSFFFIGYTAYGDGLCGGIILHNQEDMNKAYYGIHT